MLTTEEEDREMRAEGRRRMREAGRRWREAVERRTYEALLDAINEGHDTPFGAAKLAGCPARERLYL
jgi:hypothetical protein